MQQVILVLSLVMLAMNCSSDQQSKSIQTQTAEAKAAIKQLAVALKTELKGAMQAGGPVAAIGVCNTQAIPITQKVANEKGLQMGRVSLKHRNPANLPNEWQIEVLESFEQQKAEGSDIGSLVWSDTVMVDGKQEFRFMKAIPTDAVCLSCHGTNLSPDVSRILADLYPVDRATGYSQGDIRGAFVVVGRP